MSTSPLSNREFLERVRDYFPPGAEIQELDGEDKPVGDSIGHVLEEHHFYRLNCDALLSLTHSIEEIALEEGAGTFMAILQDFKNYRHFREQYWQLAATLDDVQVIGGGKTPLAHGRVKFCNSNKSIIKKFWMSLFQGAKTQVMVMAEEVKPKKRFEEKEFAGFYSFDPGLIARVRGDVTALLAGDCPELGEFRRVHFLDRAARQIQIDFRKEQRAVEVAIKKLVLDGGGCDADDFARTIAKSLDNLQRWKMRLPELLSGRR